MTDHMRCETLGELLSPSQVNTYLTCAAKWYFRYPVGLSEPATGSLALGKASHETLARNFRQKMESKRDMDAWRCQKSGALENLVTVRAYCYMVESGQLCFEPKARLPIKGRPEGSSATMQSLQLGRGFNLRERLCLGKGPNDRTA
jgi:CRISPR/Cas system-associated exonuclease Cas4 (RecB family)